MKEEGKADRDAIQRSNSDFGDRSRAKQVLAQKLDRGNALVGQSLVFRQFADELKNEWQIAFRRGPDVDMRLRVHVEGASATDRTRVCRDSARSLPAFDRGRKWWDFAAAT